MSIHTRVGGAWKNVNEAYVKVGGAWKRCQNVYVKANGVWKALLTFSVSAALPTLTNDTTKTKTFADVVVGTTMTLVYTAVNDVYDGRDYIGVGVSGAAITSGPTSGDNWKLGPSGGTYTLTCKATAPSVTVSIWGHGMTSASGTITYISDK